jgi:threonine dehydratase
MPSITLQDIQSAYHRIRDAIYHSPCSYSLMLSRLCGCEVWCKLDHLQVTGSFKERGARNKLLLLSDEQRRHGVIAASAGNHALGLAYHGQQLGIPVTVVMPQWAPFVKVANCRSFGATIILHGNAYDDAKHHALELAEQQQKVYVPGFDDPDIIAGQGTMGLEILEDVPEVDAVIVPVGGAGLIAGVGLAIKSLKPGVQIIGAESNAAPTLQASLQAGKVVKIDAAPTLADGLAVAEAGKLCLEIAQRVVDDLVLVDEPQIARSILQLMELEKAVVEGAAAVSLAAALQRRQRLAGKNLVLCLTGGNIDVTILGKIIERGLAADGRLCRIGVRISDRPGELARLASVIASTGASIKEIDHDRSFGPADVASVYVWCILETRDAAHVQQVYDAMKAAGIETHEG